MLYRPYGKMLAPSFNRMKFRYPVEKPWKVPMPDASGIEEYERRREKALDKNAFDHVHLQWFADGLFYNDLREPFISSDQNAAGTIITTDKPLALAASFPVLGGQYWARPGKKLKIRMFGRETTDGTAGNVTLDIYYGSGAAANGTILQASAAVAHQISRTNDVWWLELYIHCRATGSSGTLFVNGIYFASVTLVLSTVGPVFIPATAPAVSGAIDLTAANIISPQIKQSGAGSWNATVHDLEVISMN